LLKSRFFASRDLVTCSHLVSSGFWLMDTVYDFFMVRVLAEV
jgi:hypothetical protein